MRWYPSIGIVAAMGVLLCGWVAAWRALMRAAIVVARPVLPDPGMPLTAIRRRAFGGVDWYFPVGSEVSVALFSLCVCVCG